MWGRVLNVDLPISTYMLPWKQKKNKESSPRHHSGKSVFHGVWSKWQQDRCHFIYLPCAWPRKISEKTWFSGRDNRACRGYGYFTTYGHFSFIYKNIMGPIYSYYDMDVLQLHYVWMDLGVYVFCYPIPPVPSIHGAHEALFKLWVLRLHL